MKLIFLPMVVAALFLSCSTLSAVVHITGPGTYEIKDRAEISLGEGTYFITIEGQMGVQIAEGPLTARFDHPGTITIKEAYTRH